jgi:hypothetical protein
MFCYYDPISSLKPSIQADWRDAKKREQMANDAMAAAKARII